MKGRNNLLHTYIQMIQWCCEWTKTQLDQVQLRPEEEEGVTWLRGGRIYPLLVGGGERMGPTRFGPASWSALSVCSLSRTQIFSLSTVVAPVPSLSLSLYSHSFCHVSIWWRPRRVHYQHRRPVLSRPKSPDGHRGRWFSSQQEC